MASGSFVCGHCGTTTARELTTNLEKRVYVGVGPVQWSVLSCVACGAYTAYAVGSGLELFFPPQGHPRTPNVDKVPPLIRADYEEALGCIIAGLYKAAAAMTRRAVQGVCLDLGADEDKTLFKQIEELAKSGELTARLAGLAHGVRGLGNTGAHPRKDELDEMTKDDAARAMIFLEHLLQHVYIIELEGTEESSEGASSG